jgi:hypothetical protein
MGHSLQRIKRDARRKLEVELEPGQIVRVSHWYWNDGRWNGTKVHSFYLTIPELLTIASKVANILAHGAAQLEKRQ